MPDGKTIAFALSGTDDDRCTIYAMNAEGSGHRNALAILEGCYAINCFSWSPDGTEIAFVGGQDIYKFDVNSLGETHLTTWDGAGSKTSVENSPSWSPDGERIAFERDPSDTSTGIYVMGSDGSDPTLVREFPFGTLRPDCRPLP